VSVYLMCRIDALPASGQYHAFSPFQRLPTGGWATMLKKKTPRRKAAPSRGRGLGLYRAPAKRLNSCIANEVLRRSYAPARRTSIHSGLMFAAFMIGHHFPISAL